MHDLTLVATSRVLSQMANTAIREAVKLERVARESNCPALVRRGVEALAEVLWQLYGGYPADSIMAIQRIVTDHEGVQYLGCDGRDYIKLFEEALEDVCHGSANQNDS